MLASLQRPRLLATARPRAAGRASSPELATVLDQYNPTGSGFLSAWRGWTVSTLAVVQLREKMAGFSVPNFRSEAQALFCSVGDALAKADEHKLRGLTTPMCFATMAASLKARPTGERHEWKAVEVVASMKQVRVGHHASNEERKFAQITARITAKLVWSIRDRKGALVGGVGSPDAPFAIDDYWVFERCIGDDAAAAWRLKARLEVSSVEAPNSG